MRSAPLIVLLFSIIFITGAISPSPVKEVTRELLLGKWEIVKNQHKVSFKLEKDGQFYANHFKNGRLIWEGSGKWWLKNNRLYWDYIKTLNNKVPLGIDVDIIVSVSEEYLVLRSIEKQVNVEYKKTKNQ